MPPVSQQNSRAGLISAVVIFTILFVTATIFAIYYGVEATRLQKDYADLKSKYIPRIIPEGGLTSPIISELEAARSDPNSGLPASMALLDVAVKQRDNLAQAITGTPGTTPANALAAAAGALTGAKDRTKGDSLTLPSSDNLAGAVKTLADAVASRADQVKNLQAQVEQTQKEKAQLIADMNKALAQKDQDIRDIRAQMEKSTADVAAYSASKNQSVAEIEKNRDAERQASQEAMNKKDVELAGLRRDLDKAEKELDVLRSRLGGLRVNPNESIVRQADGQIVRISGDGIVYINRGTGDQIAPGLTFEVYDKTTGVPALGDGLSDTDMPAGKASIEVIRVGATSSEARVVRQTPGSQITEGDLIANLVYDPHTKYNFVVYGKFDMDHNGVATAQDADVIKRLISQWGGRVVDQVNVDTDFIVLGKEPAVPTFSADEERDPIIQQKIAAAKKEVQDYQHVLQMASELHIPIMNQNRFLYFTGYYDLAGR
ncbi:MAG: hypothetical protein IT447_04490 [Phycisphaerales bacterium]|jgi:hypothetical protein|nr:hypothetical protein [Phycisphaerales bacterium]